MTLRWPFNKIYSVAVLIFIVLLVLLTGLAELGARTDFVRARLPLPVIGSGHANFDLKLSLLQFIVEKGEDIDCVFIGTSMVYRGLDPEIFQKVYKEKTGKDVRCFNFGLRGLNTNLTPWLIELLDTICSPKLIILGKLPDTQRFGKEAEKILKSTPWYCYRKGKFSIKGWLQDKSYLYRYFIRFQIWAQNPELTTVLNAQEEMMTSRGYGRLTRTPGILGNKKKTKKTYSPKHMYQYKSSSLSIFMFEHIVKMRPSKKIVVAEFPFNPSFLARGVQEKKDHRQYIRLVKKITDDNKVFFLPSTSLNLIPDDGWLPYNHLNIKGARVFSRWMGEKIGDAVNEGIIDDPTL